VRCTYNPLPAARQSTPVASFGPTEAHRRRGLVRLEGVPLYGYELRRGERVIATGTFAQEDPVVVGDRVSLGCYEGLVHSVSPQLVRGQIRVVIELMKTSGSLSSPQTGRGDARSRSRPS